MDISQSMPNVWNVTVRKVTVILVVHKQPPHCLKKITFINSSAIVIIYIYIYFNRKHIEATERCANGRLHSRDSRK